MQVGQRGAIVLGQATGANRYASRQQLRLDEARLAAALEHMQQAAAKDRYAEVVAHAQNAQLLSDHKDRVEFELQRNRIQD